MQQMWGNCVKSLNTNENWTTDVSYRVKYASPLDFHQEWDGKTKIAYKPIKAVNTFFGQILLKIAGNVNNDKTGIQLFKIYF
jgi:hypothetical protein